MPSKKCSLSSYDVICKKKKELIEYFEIIILVM